jgi:hypothetical protein
VSPPRGAFSIQSFSSSCLFDKHRGTVAGANAPRDLFNYQRPRSFSAEMSHATLFELEAVAETAQIALAWGDHDPPESW